MRQLAPKLALLAASLLVALALGEVALRAVGFAFGITPEAVEFGWPDPVILKEHYAGDQDLFWVLKDYDSRLRRYAPGSLDIVFMGDSCTEFSDYPRLLLERLRADHPEREITGLKLAVGGWSLVRRCQRLAAADPAKVTTSCEPGLVACEPELEKELLWLYQLAFAG